MPCVAVSYETQEAILLILCNILQSMPVTCRGQNWTHVLLFPSLFSVERRALVTEGGWHRNVGSKDKPPRFSLIAGLLLVIKNAPKGKCHSFSLSLMFNFQFWVMHWSLPRAVFLPGPALGILDTYKAHRVLPFFPPLLWYLTRYSGCSQEKGQTQKQHFPMLQLCNDGQTKFGKASQQVWRGRLSRSPHQTFLRVYLCGQHRLPGWDTDKGKVNFPPSWSCTVVQTTVPPQRSDS